MKTTTNHQYLKNLLISINLRADNRRRQCEVVGDVKNLLVNHHLRSQITTSLYCLVNYNNLPHMLIPGLYSSVEEKRLHEQNVFYCLVNF